MGHFLFLVWWMIAVLPFVIFLEGWQMFKDFMNRRKLWWALPYFLLVILIILAIALWQAGYR